MSALHRKLLRDLIRLWPQALAIALVMAAGAATLILGVGARSALYETRTAYYERNRFADVFADLTRAPAVFADEIARIPGVATVEPRISKLALLDLPDMVEPALAMTVSLPDWREQRLDLLHMVRGRKPTPGDEREVVVNEPFARANHFDLGSTFSALINGRKRTLEIVGTALSPEFIYVVGQGDIMPDDRRYGIVWMSERTLSAAWDLTGAFSTVHLGLLRDTREAAVIEILDAMLTRYGGLGAYVRKDQSSHAFLDAELNQLEAMSKVLPPIFLVVAAFLVNMTLTRLIALEREQIGLLKALGYSDLAVGRHYLEFVAAIAAVGSILGVGLGAWLGSGLARLYGDFFHFPFLVFRVEFGTWVAALAVTLVAAFAGGAAAVTQVVRLPPAVAMQPPAPAFYRHGVAHRLYRLLRLHQTLVMVVRHLGHRPFRSIGSIFGIALSVSVLVGSLWVFGSTDLMIDVTFHQADRSDATIGFARERSYSALADVAALPGVLNVEPYRAIPVKIRHGHRERRVSISGKPRDGDLSRVLDLDFAPVRLPEDGIVLSDALAGILEVRVGDRIELELLERDRRRVEVPVTAIIQGYLGLGAYMDLDAANRMMREGALLDGVHVAIDSALRSAFFERIKETPVAANVGVRALALAKFRETLAQNMYIMITVYAVLGMIVAFGVVYNFARISLSEQGRELASLRVLGLTRGEVSGILLAELAILTLTAQPLGWAIGYGVAAAMVNGFDSELYRVPLVVEPAVYAWASAVVIVAALASALMVRRRIDRLDMIEVLKTRE